MVAIRKAMPGNLNLVPEKTEHFYLFPFPDYLDEALFDHLLDPIVDDPDLQGIETMGFSPRLEVHGLVFPRILLSHRKDSRLLILLINGCIVEFFQYVKIYFIVNHFLSDTNSYINLMLPIKQRFI